MRGSALGFIHAGGARVRGLSLIELTMVLAISAVFVYFVGGMLVAGAQAYNKISDTLASQMQLRVAMDRIAREVREVGVTLGSPNKYSFALPATTPPLGSPFTANKLTFTKNDGITVTIDGSATPALNVTYSSPAATGKLGDIASTSALAFKFFTHASTAATPATTYSIYDLGLIEIALTVTVNGVAASGTTRVALRGTTP